MKNVQPAIQPNVPLAIQVTIQVAQVALQIARFQIVQAVKAAHLQFARHVIADIT